VNIVIEMALPIFDGFLDRCDPASKEYAILKNGIIVRRPKADHFERIAEIHCDVEQAKGLLDLARRVYPDAVPDTEKALAVPRAS
jgi:hypothetical protein